MAVPTFTELPAMETRQLWPPMCCSTRGRYVLAGPGLTLTLCPLRPSPHRLCSSPASHPFSLPASFGFFQFLPLGFPHGLAVVFPLQLALRVTLQFSGPPSGHMGPFANLLSHSHHPGTLGFIALAGHTGKLCLGQQQCGTGCVSCSQGLGELGQALA